MRNLAIILAFLLSTTAQAASLDLGNLANFDYNGSDSLHNKANCNLNVGAIKQDFSGRYVQDYRMWTDGQPDANFNLRLKGPNRVRVGKDIGNGLSSFLIDIDVYVLEIRSATNNPTNISSFFVFDNTAMTGTPIPVIQCEGVSAKPRN